MNSRLKFSDHIKHIKNIRTSGTISPSSRGLITRLLASIDFSKAQCMVELGPGNGCITRELLKRLGPDSTLICLEVNNDFVAQLNALNDPRLHVYNACASSIRSILDELNIACVDFVVSSLPLAIIDDEVVAAIVESVRENLCEGGRFVQYQYSLNNWDDIKPVFREARLGFTLFNMPPAFIYECVK
jgi:phospholipid N-methyltransferase